MLQSSFLRFTIFPDVSCSSTSASPSLLAHWVQFRFPFLFWCSLLVHTYCAGRFDKKESAQSTAQQSTHTVKPDIRFNVEHRLCAHTRTQWLPPKRKRNSFFALFVPVELERCAIIGFCLLFLFIVIVCSLILSLPRSPTLSVFLGLLVVPSPDRFVFATLLNRQ